MRVLFLSCILLAASTQAFAVKPCDELKSEIASKLDASKVSGYSLEILPKDTVREGKVVGTCEGGTKKIVYLKK